MSLVTDYHSSYSSPFYAGVATADSSTVPGTYAVAINGHPYMLNTDPNSIETYGDLFKEESLALLRAQADQGNRPGEQSLSPAQFWRRSQDSWHGGAGQSMLDRDISDPLRFNSSKGVNPWTRYQLTLLNTTTNIRASVNSNLLCVAANTNVYICDGTAIVGTSNLTAFSTVTGTPGVAATSIATNGGLVWTAHTASGIYQTNGAAATSYVTGTVTVLGFAKGRLLAAHNQALYNPVQAGTLATAGPAGATSLFYTHPDTGWVWTAFADGDQFIYAAGNVGDKSRVYRITIQPDGTGLTIPVVAASLPSGEVVQSLLGYLGFIVIGTNKGVRFATASEAGGLTLGALIPTPGPVYTLDAVDRFVWFGWTNYDTASSGLGRFDMSVINDGLAPAYASDLMATGQGTVRGQGLQSALNRRVFTVDGLGVFAEQLTPVTSGSILSGQINYGIADAKVPIAVDLKHAPLAASNSVVVALSSDRATAVTIGSSAVLGSVGPVEPITAGARKAEEFELTMTMNSSAGVGPTLTRWTLLAYPAPVGASVYTLPLVLASRLDTFISTDVAQAPFDEYMFLTGLHESREIITIQVGVVTFEGTLESFKWVPHHHSWQDEFERGWWNGTFIASVRRIKN